MKIRSKVIQDSISEAGIRITTLELEYPRFIHSEFMTHRVFSRNAASSRAIPIDKVMEQVLSNTAKPIYWGENKAGMSATREVVCKYEADREWDRAACEAVRSARALQGLGLHKQIVNRVMEPFQMIKVVVTATEWFNFFGLRMHPDAQPEMQELAKAMSYCIERSIPILLLENDWHVPYVNRSRITERGNLSYQLDNDDNTELDIGEAIKVSVSCCAQVSYRLNDQHLDKANKIYDKLVNSRPIHASPLEHQAHPIIYYANEAWSGNFRGYHQNRKILERMYKIEKKELESENRNKWV